MSQPAEIETFPARRIVAYGAAMLFSSGEANEAERKEINCFFFPFPIIYFAQLKQNGLHSAKISLKFIAFIFKMPMHQTSLGEIVNFFNAFPCAGVLIFAYPMLSLSYVEGKMCENIGLTAYIYKGDPNHYRTREILTITPGPNLFFEETASLINNKEEREWR